MDAEQKLVLAPTLASQLILAQSIAMAQMYKGKGGNRRSVLHPNDIISIRKSPITVGF